MRLAQQFLQSIVKQTSSSRGYQLTFQPGILRAMSHTYEYPRPALTVDTIVISQHTADVPAHVLLIQRKHPPCKGEWALPGGFVDENEPLDQAAARELEEETSVDPKNVELVQVGTYGKPGRDPRGWTVTVAYGTIVLSMDLGVQAADDAQDAQWFSIHNLPKLAFDHKTILQDTFLRFAKDLDQGDMAEQMKKAAKQI